MHLNFLREWSFELYSGVGKRAPVVMASVEKGGLAKARVPVFAVGMRGTRRLREAPGRLGLLECTHPAVGSTRDATPLTISSTIQNQINPVADGHSLRTGNKRHQTPNATRALLRTMNPSSRSDEIMPVRNLAGGKDSQRRPTYSSVECAI
jgi:hypothetical protein